MKNLSIYIHIPFCIHKCNYCNFVSYCNQNSKMQAYVDSVIKEIRLRGKEYGKNHDIVSVYIGGGTPSYLKEGMIANIMTELKNNFRIMPNCEMTIETNPNSITENKLREYRLVGFNRISIGAQSLNDKILNLLGRQHDSKVTKNAVKLAKKVGFKNINLDMLLALPTQKMKDVKKIAEYCVKQKVTHISPYSLILEEGTLLFKMVKAGKVKLPSEDESVEMYNFVFDYLKKHGYSRYEVSNFSLPDYESRHNMNYWTGGDYLAMGLAGHSFMNNVRFANTDNIDTYIDNLSKDKIPVVSSEKIDLMHRKEEAIMLLLRTREGINLKEFDLKYGGNLLRDKKKEIEFLTHHNFISVKNDYLRVKDNAFYVLNSIILKLV